ncbi:MAG: AMP-binding protein [Pseudomonadota bacterium]
MDLGSNFLASAARSPSAVALTAYGERLTYSAWSVMILQVLSGLNAAGIKRGHTVAAVLQNGVHCATLYWACQIGGIIFAPLNWRATEGDLSFLICDCEASAVVFDTSITHSAVLADIAHETLRIDAGPNPPPGWMSFQDLFHSPPAQPRSCAMPQDTSIVLYTSGTTGRPKGVPRTQASERAAALGHIAQNLYRRGESILGVMPIYHTMGVKALVMAAMLDGSFHCLNRFDPEAALSTIAKEGVTSLSLVPTLYHDLIHVPSFSKDAVRTVRSLTSAGGPMSPTLAKRLFREFEPDIFVNQLGSTEIYTHTFNPNAQITPQSVGKAGLLTSVRLVSINAQSADDFVGPEEEGEIIVSLRADDAFTGYWKRPDADSAKIRNGWYWTGDAAKLLPSGDLVLTGRVDDLIITGGENVSPIEVEACLISCEGVNEAVVFGLEDERWGQVVAAAVKGEALYAHDLDTHCREFGLMSHQRPRDYYFVDEIPKSPVGKVLRRVLIEEFGKKRSDGSDRV